MPFLNRSTNGDGWTRNKTKRSRYPTFDFRAADLIEMRFCKESKRMRRNVCKIETLAWSFLQQLVGPELKDVR